MVKAVDNTAEILNKERSVLFKGDQMCLPCVLTQQDLSSRTHVLGYQL